MRQSRDVWIEAAALVAIAFTLAWGGRALLATLHAFAPAGVALLGAAVIAMSLAIRRVYRAQAPDRLELTRYVADVTAFALAIWAVASPARWVVGATIAMIELAIAFDLIVLFARRSQT